MKCDRCGRQAEGLWHDRVTSDMVCDDCTRPLRARDTHDSRDVFDLLWAVARWSQAFGYESARPGADRTKADRAYRERRLALARALNRLTVMKGGEE